MATSKLDPQKQDDNKLVDSNQANELENWPVLNKEPTYDAPGNAPSSIDRPKKEKRGNNLADRESSGEDYPSSFYRKGEESGSNEEKLGAGYSAHKKKSGTLRFNFSKRGRLIGAGITAGLMVVSVFIFTFFSGPLQFIHFAQILQKSHLTRTVNFGNDRTSKVLLYSLASTGVQYSRLGIVGNIAANAWEKRLIRDTGLRPLYDERTRRLSAFEIVDEDKALKKLLGISEKGGRNARKVESAMGKGAEIRTAGEASEGRQKFVDKHGNMPKASQLVIDISKVKTGERRKFSKSINKSTDVNNIASTVGSRLLAKRGGVDFHPLKTPKRYVVDKGFNKWQARKDAAKRDREGVKISDGLPIDRSTDADGNPNQSAEDIKASEGANGALEEARKIAEDAPDPKSGGQTLKSLRMGIAKAAGPTVVVGILCTAKSFGNDIESFKFANNYMPMLRMGMRIITMGNAVMLGQNVNLDELGAFNDALYDEETKTSWTQARSIRAELKQPLTEYDIPEEAQLKNISDKPWLFDKLDNTPVFSESLGLACAAIDKVGGLPIIRNVLGAASKMTNAVANGALGAVGTSIEELTQKALGVASGQSVNLLAEGAEMGGLANMGAFLAGNDNAISMGGAPMSSSSLAALRTQEKIDETQEIESQSIAKRLFDPYSPNSVVGKVIDSSPTSNSQIASIFTNPFRIFGNIPKIFNNITPSAQAVEPYDYGVPAYGFTLEEQQDERFENPYENAVIVESKLDELNEKYGKCFSMKILTDGDRIRIESDASSTNVFKVSKEDDCKSTSEDMLRYRFYLADSVTAASLACYEGDDSYCSQLGFGSSGSSESSATTSTQLTSLNGHPLSADQTKWIKYVLDNVRLVLPGNTEAQAAMAARVSWWALKEGVFSLDNPLAYSNCNFPSGDQRIGVVDTCPSGRAWQVGLAGVQVPNFSLSEVESVAKQRHPGKSVQDILDDTSTSIGIPKGSDDYNKAINSTGDLRKSILLRDPATGFVFVDRNIVKGCIDSWLSWCGGGWDAAKNIASSQSVAKSTIAELTSYFKGSGNISTDGDVKKLAQKILSISNITYPYETVNGSTRFVMESLSKGEQAPVTCPGRETRTSINPGILQFLLELGSQSEIGVNALTDKCHSPNSNHYKGSAVDFECHAVSFDVSRADPIAAKYGGKRNFETCSNASHWHYDFVGAQ